MDFDADDVEELDARKRVQRQPTGLTRPGVHPAAIDVHNPAMTLGHRVPLRMPGRSGPADGRESTADENVPAPLRPLLESSCFMRCRRQAPTGRHANPTFAGWLG